MIEFIKNIIFTEEEKLILINFAEEIIIKFNAEKNIEQGGDLNDNKTNNTNTYVL